MIYRRLRGGETREARRQSTIVVTTVIKGGLATPTTNPNSDGSLKRDGAFKVTKTRAIKLITLLFFCIVAAVFVVVIVVFVADISHVLIVKLN